MSNDWDVVVIGAGLAGLAAGATATRAGARTVVVDAHTPGGRARVTAQDGFLFNRGVHALYRSGAGMDVLRQLGIEPLGEPPPLSRYQALAGGRLHPLPIAGVSSTATSLLGRRDAAALGAVFTRLPLTKPSDHAGTPVNAWIEDLDLRPTAARVLSAIVRLATYASDLDTFSAEAAIAQMRTAAQGVLYLHGGWDQLIDALTARCEVHTCSRVVGVEPAAGRLEVLTGDRRLVANAVVVAVGRPRAAERLLTSALGLGGLGPELTAACLDAGVRRAPDPGYLLGVDAPLYVTTQSPPARQAQTGQAVVAAVRYGATDARADRVELEAHLARAGVNDGDVVTSRFLARMVVTGATPIAARGGLVGRPAIDATSMPGLFLAGDWVGPDGLLADAALASGRSAGLRAAGVRTVKKSVAP